MHTACLLLSKLQTDTRTSTQGQISSKQLRSAVSLTDSRWERESSGIWSFIRWTSAWFSTLRTLKFTFASQLELTHCDWWLRPDRQGCRCDKLTSSAREEALWRTGIGLCLSYCLNFSWICNTKSVCILEQRVVVIIIVFKNANNNYPALYFRHHKYCRSKNIPRAPSPWIMVQNSFHFPSCETSQPTLQMDFTSIC